MEHLPNVCKRRSVFESVESEDNFQFPDENSVLKMEHDVALPVDDPLVKQCERRSLSESEDSFQTPDTKSEITYPVGYSENVRTEIEQWRAHLTKILEDQKKVRNERAKLETTVIDESLLSEEQRDFFKSLKFDEYLRRADNFLDRVEILVEKLSYKPEDDLERKCLAVERKLTKDVLEKHF